MKRYYRTRHATFIKTLLDQKSKKHEAEEEQRAKDEKRKKKLKDKVIANMMRKEELPPIDHFEHHEETKTNKSMFSSQIIGTEKAPARNRGLSVSVMHKDREGTSMSARGNQLRAKQMAGVYCAAITETEKQIRVMDKRLARQSSRRSMRSNRSSRSVKAP